MLLKLAIEDTTEREFVLGTEILHFVYYDIGSLN